ncbi:hypothetical protein C9374_006365 [Naegleria lovaniensis]|uniref:Uncharacterized protein n=1 Tax=Naegleria lovaniensis TaxID=51637 RepID=A0AA88GI41_NAELO|nr:uncharacterized protein C9374_006365 [Naegleria lovaniensis]KAG2381376.1 hypothetical protein C9374_006365 [Naegleria lovaniensis]
MAVFFLDTKNFVFGVLFLFALFEVLIIWNMKGTMNVRDNKHSNYEESCLDILSSSESKDYCNCSVIHHRELENQENTNAKPSSCPLDEIWQKENNTRFPEKHFSPHFSHESQWKDSRAVRVFSRLRIPQEMKVFREFMLSQKEIDYYRTVEPAKLSSSTEEIFCREPSRSYLKELTEKCRAGAKRSFVDGGYCARQKRFGKPQISSKKVITVIHRLGAGSRVVSNHRDVMNKVQEQFSKEHIVQEYIIDHEQSQNMIRIAQKFFESDIIVSPHGARPHVTSIVELSWDNNSDMFLPADYMCFSRNLKIRYSVVAGKGKHTSMLEIPDDVVTAIRDHLEHLPKR